jgi:hypothetical protein
MERRMPHLNLQELLDDINMKVGASKSRWDLGLHGIVAQNNTHKVRFAPTPYDILAQCPKCKTVETLQFVGHTLTPSRKFRQIEGRIYHDCGSLQPCRLHR